MRFTPRFALNFVALLATTGLTGTPVMAADQGDDGIVQAVGASSITPTSAVLEAKVGGENKPATYHFEYGTTSSYGTSTPDAVAPATEHPERVSATVTGLAPASTYHLRAVASNSEGTKTGHDVTFVTPAPPADPQASTPPAPSTDPEASTPPAAATPPAPQAVLGHSVVTMPASGIVLVRLPGASHSVPLGSAQQIPTNSVIDATHGKVSLTSALTGGRSQTGAFWGGAFRVRQSRSGTGLTDLYLVGPRLPRCAASRRAGTSSATISRSGARRRTLWGHDHHGLFRTHGANSVATVRGTTWATADTCAGTLTVVREGSVTVHDQRRHRNVVVRAGHRYLARAHSVSP